MWIDDGNAHAARWDPAAGAPAPFIDAVRALAKAVTDVPVIGVLVTTDQIWGPPCKAARVGQPWRHLAVAPPAALIHPTVIDIPAQVAAERREDRATLQRGLDEFPPEPVKTTVALLQTEQMIAPRSTSESPTGCSRFTRCARVRGAIRSPGILLGLRKFEDPRWIGL